MDTPRLGLPEIQAAQAQKHVTHNAALAILDALVQASVINRTTTGAPVSPAAGDCYIVASPATGAWAGQDDALATWDGSGWVFYAPRTGTIVFDQDTAALVLFTAAWDVLPTVTSFSEDLEVRTGAATLRLGQGANAGPHGVEFYGQDDAVGVKVVYRTTPETLGFEDGTGQAMVEFPHDRATGIESFAPWDFNSSVLSGIGQIGIGGASPDATNKFAFYGTNLLFNSGGSIDATFNKNAVGNDASFSYKTGFSTRALAGLLGNDDYTVKVSPDGSSFFEAIVADRASGAVRFPGGMAGTGSPAKRLGGQVVAITGSEGGFLVAGDYQSMGNGDANISGAVMPFPGKVLSATMSVSGGTAGNAIMSMALNKVEKTTHQVALNYSGGGGSETAVADFDASPLAFAAGDALNMVCNTPGRAADVVTTFFVQFD